MFPASGTGWTTGAPPATKPAAGTAPGAAGC
jgi:hypothetical protein